MNTSVYLKPLLTNRYFVVSKGFLLLVMLVLCHKVDSQEYTFTYTPEARAIYQDITNLKLTKAYGQIVDLKKADPTNLVFLHLENYVDFFYFFINEDEPTYRVKKGNRDYRLKALDQLNDDNPYKSFVQAEILLQWSLIKLKFNEKLSAARDIVRASSLLEDNHERFPTFIDNLKSLSIIHVLGESIPAWLRTITGIRGSIQQGIKEIEQISDHALATDDYLFKEEVATIHAYTLFYQLNKKKEALEVLNRFDMDHTKSPLINFVISGMHQKLGNNDLSITLLEARPKGGDYSQFAYLDFMLGKAKLNQLDPSSILYIKRFLKDFKGRHYIKEAYQKLGWAELVINNDLAAYKKHMYNVQNHGQTLLDEDSQALTEAKSDLTPNPELLKARLLFDGGYYGKAQSTLVKSEHLMKTKEDKIEFRYRLGRIMQYLKNPFEAIESYQMCYQLGMDNSAYFATSSALNLGFLYEDLKDFDKAKDWYRKCLDLSPAQYKSSLHQKAKSGLSRLGK